MGICVMKMRIWRIVKKIFKIIIVVLVLIPLCGIVWLISCATYLEIGKSYRPSVQNVFDEIYIAAKEPEKIKETVTTWHHHEPGGLEAISFPVSDVDLGYRLNFEKMSDHFDQDFQLPTISVECCLVDIATERKTLTFTFYWKECGEYGTTLKSVFVSVIYLCTKKTLTYEIQSYPEQDGVEVWNEHDSETLDLVMDVILSDWFYYMSENSKFSMENRGTYTEIGKETPVGASS